MHCNIILLLLVAAGFDRVCAAPSNPYWWYGWNPQQGWTPETGTSPVTDVHVPDNVPNQPPIILKPIGTGVLHHTKTQTHSSATSSIPSAPPTGGASTGIGDGAGSDTGSDTGEGGGSDGTSGGGIVPINTQPITSRPAFSNQTIPATGNPNPANETSGDDSTSTVSAGNPTGSQVCDSTSVINYKGYYVMANIWDQNAGGGGKQCAQTLTGGTGKGIAWSTDWQWSGNSIASFAMANGQVPMTPCGPVSSLGPIQTEFQWSYDNDNIVADVAYDMFTSAGSASCTPIPPHDYEIMIWLAAYGGLLPLGNQNPPIGTYQDSGSGQTFEIWKGDNGAGGIKTVYSFVPQDKTTQIKNFKGDLSLFLKHLASIDSDFAATSLQAIQAGTEAQSGKGTFTVSNYYFDGGKGDVATS